MYYVQDTMISSKSLKTFYNTMDLDNQSKVYYCCKTSYICIIHIDIYTHIKYFIIYYVAIIKFTPPNIFLIVGCITNMFIIK